MSWRSVEPRQGVFNSAYVAAVRARYAAFRAAGLRVVVDLGVQYPPSWVFRPAREAPVRQPVRRDVLRGARGRRSRCRVGTPTSVCFAAASGSDVGMAGSALSDLSLAGLRVGGGPYGELRLPEPYYNGHSDAWWGFGPAAMRTNPGPDWRPGQADSAKAARFLNWYQAR